MMSDNQLGTYFEFTGVDLEANRLGKITSSQKERRVKSEDATHLISAVIAVVAILLTLIPLGILIYHLITGTIDQIGWGLFIWILIGAILSFFSVRRSIEKVYDFSVHKIEGPVSFRSEISISDSEELDYTLHIQGEMFDVDDRLVEMMEEGDIYAIYYLVDPYTHSPMDILSLELILSHYTH
jgi:F0F1-type ATP synthase assembly protein I